MSHTRIIHYVHGTGDQKNNVLIENDGSGKWIAFLLPSKEVLVKCDAIEECKSKANEILDGRESTELSIVVFGLAKDVDSADLYEKILEKLEGHSISELQGLNTRILQAHLSLPYDQLITEGMQEKLGIVEKTINVLANWTFHGHDETIVAIATSNDVKAMTTALEMLAKGNVDQAYKLIDEYDLWDKIGPFLESGGKTRGKANVVANVESPISEFSQGLPFQFALYKYQGKKIVDVIKEIAREEGVRQSDLFAMILLCFTEMLYKKGLVDKAFAQKISVDSAQALSKKGQAVYARVRFKLMDVIKDILVMIEAYTNTPVSSFQKPAHVQTALTSFIINANLMPGPACLQLRKPLPWVLKDIKEKYYASIEDGMAKLRDEFPSLTKKEGKNIIETIFAREFKHRDVFSLPRLSNAENKVVIKYRENISTVARQIYEFAKKKVMIGTWDETLEILDFIEKMFLDAMKDTQTENMLINIDKAFITMSSGIAPQELVLLSIDDIKAELHRQFSSDIKALISEMRNYGNVSSNNIYKAIESYINAEEFGKIADVIPRQKVVKALKQVYGTKIKNFVKTMIARSRELVELFRKQNDKPASPNFEQFQCTREVIIDVIEEGRDLIDIIYDKWRSNDKLVSRLQQEVDAIKRATHLSYIAGKTISETEATWGIILSLFKENFEGVFEEEIAINDEEKDIAARFTQSFREICQSEIIIDLSIVKEQGVQGELIRRLYQLVIGMTRNDASLDKSGMKNRIKNLFKR